MNLTLLGFQYLKLKRWVSISEIEEVNLVPSPKDKVAPEGFYSTSHHVTHIYYKGEWILVEEIEMDCLIVIDEENKTARCKPIADIKEGDLIVVGREGVKITPPQRSRGKQGVFEFMNSEVSSEKPMMSIINDVATEIKNVKANGGKIALVGGPAIVHTGSAGIVAQLIKEGFIDVIFAGKDEVITLSHRAYSRAVFGKGAVEAAKFLAGKGPGLYTMSDVLR